MQQNLPRLSKKRTPAGHPKGSEANRFWAFLMQGENMAYDTYADWNNEPFQRPEMMVETTDRFIHPVGFTDKRFKQMAEENGRNERMRRCQIRTVRLK